METLTAVDTPPRVHTPIHSPSSSRHALLDSRTWQEGQKFGGFTQKEGPFTWRGGSFLYDHAPRHCESKHVYGYVSTRCLSCADDVKPVPS